MTAMLEKAGVYEAGVVRRVRSTKAEMETRKTTLVEIAREAQPTSVRHVYYRAVVAGIVPKTEAGYAKVQRAILELRRTGRIPFGWIVDNGRRAHWPIVEKSPEDALHYLGQTYRRDPWRSHEARNPRVEVWVESESIAGVLEQLKDQYAVPIFPLKGQSSESFAWQAARDYNLTYRFKRIHVLYAGDYDPAGLEIGSQLEGKLRAYSGRDDLEFTRLAVTDRQAGQLQSAGLGTKAKKRSWVDYDGLRHEFEGQAVEAEAIDSPIMRRLFAHAIENIALDHYGYDIFTENSLIEAEERQRLQELAEEWSA